MKTHILKLIARLTIVVTLAVNALTAMPVGAASVTNIRDQLSRIAVSATGVTHNLTGTVPTDTWGSGETLVFTYTNYTAFTAVTPSTCTISVGTLGSCVSSAPNVLTLTCGTGPCGGSLVVTGSNWTHTNPSSPGANSVTVSGTGDVTGSFTLVTVSDDQVTVTASVEPAMTFNVGAQAPPAATCDTTFAGNGGTVALGTLTSTSISSSDVGGVNHICTRASTNAIGGIAVSVRSTNGRLQSTSVPTDFIPSATAAMAAGTANYGLCASDTVTGQTVTVPAGSAPARQAPFNGSCAANTAAGSVGALTTSPQNVWTTTGPTTNGFYNLVIKAAISGTTPAHNDYVDTLTFVATGTF